MYHSLSFSIPLCLIPPQSQVWPMIPLLCSWMMGWYIQSVRSWSPDVSINLEYLVDWEGCSPDERSWVTWDDLLNPTVFSTFYANHPSHSAPHGWGRPQL